MARRSFKRARLASAGDAKIAPDNRGALTPESTGGEATGSSGADRGAAPAATPRDWGGWNKLSETELAERKRKAVERARETFARKRAAKEHRAKQREQAQLPKNDLKPAATKPTANTFSQSGIAKLLYSVHFMAASFMHEEALKLDEKESDQLGRVIMEASAAWGHPELSDKALATLNLCGTLVIVYAPRAIVIARKRRPAAPILPPAPTPAAASSPYVEAARATAATAAAAPAATAAAPRPAQPTQVVRPNGSGYVQTSVSPFGDQDGMAL